MDTVRSRSEAFAAEMFAGLPRRDQRATGELYVHWKIVADSTASAWHKENGSDRTSYVARRRRQQ
jgi:hypothetical protein